MTHPRHFQEPLLSNTVQTPAPPPDQPARFAVMGLLREPARTYTRTDGRTVLEVVITQHLQGLPEARHVLARYLYPDHGCPATTAMVAARKVRGMPAGTEVVALGGALYTGQHRGQPVTVLGHVRGIEPAAALQPRAA